LNVNELLEKCRALLAENHSLREENELLKARLGITDPPQPEPPHDPENHLPLAFTALESPGKNPQPEIPNH
jgi:regulator of replication initiation timing